MAENVHLTPAQARQAAQQLLDAADKVEAVQGNHDGATVK